jgi:hypothetical protein
MSNIYLIRIFSFPIYSIEFQGNFVRVESHADEVAVALEAPEWWRPCIDPNHAQVAVAFKSIRSSSILPKAKNGHKSLIKLHEQLHLTLRLAASPVSDLAMLV